MSFLDIFFIFLFIGFGFGVYRSGFVKEFFLRLSWVGSAVIAFLFSSIVGFGLMKNVTGIKSEPVLYILAFICLFVVSHIVIKGVGSLVGEVFKLPVLYSLDHVLGMFLGFFEASIVISLIIEVLLIQSFIPDNYWMADSRIVPFFIKHILRMNFV